RQRFTASEWWDIAGEFATESGEPFGATLVALEGKRLVTGKDFDRATGELKGTGDELLRLDKAQATHWSETLGGQAWEVTSLEEKPSQSHPAPPFTTSTLQQEANRKLRFSAKRTMQAAQRLYEGGYITYMRTDSTTLSSQALAAARELIGKKFAPEYLPAKARIYKTKVKNAQEAHEAIRPAGARFQEPGELSGVEKDQQRLYDLVYRRTLACQMTPARILQTTAEIGTPGEAAGAVFQATGKVVEFPGFLAVYGRGEGEDQNGDKTLPPLAQGARLTAVALEPKQHETKPPARYTEATLIKELESLGIGRPSTYASIMETIQRREYVVKQKGALVATFVAVAVVRLMEQYFADLVDYQFTARMEDVLDEISRGERESLPYLKSFYFGEDNGQGLKELLDSPIDPREACTITLGQAEDELPVQVRIGRYGPYLEHGDQRTNLELDLAPAELSLERALELLERGSEFPKELGRDPATDQVVLLKKGRFGFYLQLGTDEEKTKQKSLLPGMQPEEVGLERALEILSLPRELGKDPESGEMVLADLGRYGPYLKNGKTNRSLPKGEDLLSVDLERALEILKQKSGTARVVLRSLGTHPETAAEVQIKDGRYGPYITDGTTNVSLKKGEEPEAVTLAEAVDRLAAKAAAGPSKKRYPRRSKKSS
ncbi:MAG: type I DNA topoisomerase, partial [Candidatus Neomarinimicrobiota bacterium]